MTTTYVRIRKFEIRVVELANFYKITNYETENQHAKLSSLGSYHIFLYSYFNAIVVHAMIEHILIKRPQPA